MGMVPLLLMCLILGACCARRLTRGWERSRDRSTMLLQRLIREIRADVRGGERNATTDRILNTVERVIREDESETESDV